MNSEIDPDYEYDAPQFVDFTAQQLDPDADKWFDLKAADEGGVAIANATDQDTNELFQEPKDVVHHDNVVVSEIPGENVSTVNTSEQEKKAKNDETKEFVPKKQPPKNVVTSLAEWVSKASAAPPVVMKGETKNIDSGSRSQAKRKRERKESVRKSARLRNMSTSSTSSTCSSASSVSDGCPVDRKGPKIKPQLVVPVTPIVLRRSTETKTAPSHAQKDREATELEIIAQKQKELAEKLKQNKSSMKKALAGQSYMPFRSAVDNLTHPQEFHFATDDRLGPSNNNVQGTIEKEKSFVGSLRQHPPSPTFKNRKPTKPVPFKMMESRKRKEPDNDDNPVGQYQSMAQKVYQWQKKTPERFRVKPLSEQNQGPPQTEIDKVPPKLTAPKTPNLKARDRKRTTDCVSREEQERMLAAEMKNYKFKATELNHKIFECNGTLGVFMEPKKPLTEIEPFHFQSEERAELHKAKDHIDHEEEEEHFKAQALPDFSNVFKPELPHHCTESQPFSFDGRDKEMKQRKDEAIKAIILEEEKKASEFRAQPLPSFHQPPLPSSTKSLTEPAPFNLSTENRGAVKAEKWGQKLQQEVEGERMKRVFKARPTNVLYSAPFLPDKSFSKPNTKIEEFTMNSDKRAKEREIYEMHKVERELEEEEIRRQLEKEREEEEKINIKNLRKQLVHKPNPIRKYRAVEIKQSGKELTNPQSPEWQSKKRRKLRV